MIFNYSVSKLTSAALEAFGEAYLCFQYLPRKKNAEAIKFLEILKKYRIKYIFV